MRGHKFLDRRKYNTRQSIKEYEASGKVVPHDNELRELAGLKAKPRRPSPGWSAPKTPVFRLKSEAERRQVIEKYLAGEYHH